MNATLAVRQFLRRAATLAAIGIGVVAAEKGGLTADFNNRLTELRFLAEQRSPTGNIVLVDIDAKSLSEIGVWPWPRSLHGQLVGAAGRLGAARIGFDVDFSASSQPEADQAFAAALAEAHSETFLAAFIQQESTGSSRMVAAMPTESLLRHSWPALVNVPIDADGQVRAFPSRLEIAGEALASMPAVLSNREDAPPLVGIDYSIDASQLSRVSYVDLLRNRVPAETISGKTLIVGATALELRDLFVVPASGVISGSTIIALATETLIQNRELRSIAPPAILLISVAGLAILGFARVRSSRMILALTGLAAALELGALYLQVSNAVVLQTASLHLVLAGLGVWGLTREFNLRRLLLWIARTELSNEQRVLEHVIKDGFDGVVILDEQNKVVTINRAAAELLGSGTIAGLHDLPPEMRNNVRSSRAAFLHGELPVRNSLQQKVAHSGRELRIIEYSVAPFTVAKITDDQTEDAKDAAFVCIMMRDVTERELAQERMRFLALHDSLTGLNNRAALEQQLELWLSAETVTGLALLYFDLDRFKAVNDALGHAVGDKVLVETAQRALKVLPDFALVARVGGDEFSALLPGCSLEAAQQWAEAIATAIAQPFQVGGHMIHAGASIGISSCSTGTETASALMRQADIALYSAKRSGPGRVVTFEPSMDEARLARLELERDLAVALDKNEFEVVYQPQMSLQSGQLVGVEALLRWRRSNGELVSPVRFIPVAEEMGLIHGLGAWALATACREAMEWPAPIKLAVNISPIQLEAGDLVEAVRQALTGSQLPAERLELEITESTFMRESRRLSDSFDRLLELGVKFSLDDFGTGYSSLAYLHRYPISKIKIDRSFVTGVPADGHSMAILRSVMALAEGLHIRTIAEGIETSEQAEALRVLGCDDGQGYLFSKPIRPAQVRLLLERELAGQELSRAAAA